VLDQPTLVARGPSEAFRGTTTTYRWLLDHPDQAVKLWRQLGATCTDIQEHAGGRFLWTDHQGGNVHWDTVYRAPDLHIWYAEGTARPMALLPALSGRAVVVLHINEAEGRTKRVLIHQQADLYLQTDNKTAFLVAKLLGAAAPRLGEQSMYQLQIFFSALAWYLDRYADRPEAATPAPVLTPLFLPIP
jgi:hypothetical protein